MRGSERFEMSDQGHTRREFLRQLAKGAAYTAPVITTFAVAPDLFAQAGSPPGHGHMGHGKGKGGNLEAPSSPSAPLPSEKNPPPSQKGG